MRNKSAAVLAARNRVAALVEANAAAERGNYGYGRIARRRLAATFAGDTANTLDARIVRALAKRR